MSEPTEEGAGLNPEGITPDEPIVEGAGGEGVQPTNGDEPGSEPSHNDDPYHGLSREAVIEQMEALKNNQTAQVTALNEKMAGILEQMQGRENGNRESAASQQAEQRIAEVQSKLKAQWADKLEEGGGEAVFEAMNAGFMDMLDIIREERDAALAAVKGETDSRLQSLDPVYRANKVEADKLAEQLGISPQKAIEALRTVGKLKEPGKVSQPGKVKAPGRTTDQSTATKSASQSVKMSDADKAILMGTGVMTEADIAELEKSLAQ